MPNKPIELIVGAMNKYDNFLLLGHINPDGDTLSSQLALYLILKKMDKNVVIWSKDPLPELYGFLPGSSVVQCVGENPPDETFEVVFVLDVGEPDRVGFPIPKHSGELINIDHHPKVPDFGSINCVDETASSTAEMVYRLALALDIDWDADIAVNLYTGLLTDTGSFKFENTTRETFVMAAHLVECGVKPNVVANNVFHSIPQSRLRLLSRCLNSLEVIEEYRIASVVLTLDDYAAENVPITYTEDFINFPRSLRSASAAILFKEIEKNFYKVSLRSKGVVDISTVARTLGGGGHKNAASGKIRATLPEAKKRVFELVRVAVIEGS